MSRPTFNLKIRETSALIVMIALVLALFVQSSTYRSMIIKLEREVQNLQSKNIFNKFMSVTFGDLGPLVVKEPQEIRLHVFSAGGKKIELDQSSPKDILSLLSTGKGKKLPNVFGLKFYSDFTSISVDDQHSYFDPVPFAALEFTRDGNNVLVFLGKEDGQDFAKVFVLDASQDRKNANYGWFKFDSSLIDKMVGGVE